MWRARWRGECDGGSGVVERMEERRAGDGGAAVATWREIVGASADAVVDSAERKRNPAEVVVTRFDSHVDSMHIMHATHAKATNTIARSRPKYAHRNTTLINTAVAGTCPVRTA